MSENDTASKLRFRTPHIQIKDPEACLKCARKQCTIVCPAGVYHWDAEQLKINVDWPACLESGTCLVACYEFKNIEMTYPDAGQGVRYNYG